eukprot:11213477-Lingulodinium_polyedra.AAC.1
MQSVGRTSKGVQAAPCERRRAHCRLKEARATEQEPVAGAANEATMQEASEPLAALREALSHGRAAQPSRGALQA